MNSSEIARYIEEQSSFGFEIQVARRMAELGWSVQHSGTYKDPSTGIYRQYDLQAFQRRCDYFVYAAAECKKIADEYPLVISCRRSESQEAFHQIMRALVNTNTCRSDRVRNSELYPENTLIGKSMEQYSVSKQPKARDEIRTKFSQAQQSAIAMTSLADAQTRQNGRRSFISPCLVVPDGLLWICEFDDHGQPIEPPRKVERIPLFIGLASNYQLSASHPVVQHAFSYLEILTLSGLGKFTEAVNRTADWSHIFDF